MRLSLMTILLSVALSLGSSPSWAGDIPWHSLSKEEKRILRRARERWDELPTKRQRRLLRGAQRWQHMDDDEREDARERWKERREHRREKHRHD